MAGSGQNGEKSVTRVSLPPMRNAIVAVAIAGAVLTAAPTFAKAPAGRQADRRFRRVDLGRASAVAQGDVDARRSAGRRAVERAEPVRRLPHDGDLRPRVGIADIQGAGLLCRRRRCRQLIGHIRQQMARAPGAGQSRTMDLSDFVRLGQGGRADRGARPVRRWRRSTAGRARSRSARPTRSLPTFARAADCSTQASTISSLPAAATTS